VCISWPGLGGEKAWVENPADGRAAANSDNCLVSIKSAFRGFFGENKIAKPIPADGDGQGVGSVGASVCLKSFVQALVISG